MLDAIRARIEAGVPDLDHRVKKAGDFARVMRSGAAPTGGLTGFVLPSGLTGQAPDAVHGFFTQPIRRGVTVVLMLQASDPLGARALDRIDALLDELCVALCGWAPGDQVGVFSLASARVAPGGDGLITYLVDFQINDQLRIPT